MREVRSGFSCADYNESGNGIPHLRPMNISRRGRLVFDELKHVAPEAAEGKPRAAAGDVLFNNTNSAELVGKTAPVNEGEWAFSNHMTLLRPFAGVSHKFVAFQLHYLWERGYFRIRRTQHINQASVSAATLSRTVPLLVPPSEEQRRIVDEIDTSFERLDAANERLNRALDGLRNYQQHVLRSVVDGTLVASEAELAERDGRTYESGAESLARLLSEAETLGGRSSAPQRSIPGQRYWSSAPLDVSHLPTLPTGWAWARVSQVGEVTLGRRRTPKDHHGPHMRPYLRVANVFEDRIDTSDVLRMNFSPREFETFALQHGDILLNEGQSPELVGRPAMFRNEVLDACFQSTLIRFRARHGVSPTFALLVFRAYLHSGRFQRAAKWSTNIAHLSAERFADLEFPLPPLAEQERIVVEAERRLSAADQLRLTINSVLQRIDAARHGVLDSAFAGSLVPQLAGVPSGQALVESIRSTPVVKRKRPTTSQAARKVKLSSAPTTGRQRAGAIEIRDAFGKSGGRLTPERLFEMTGLGEGLVDEFFKVLKHEEAAGRLLQHIDSSGKVTLTYRENDARRS